MSRPVAFAVPPRGRSLERRLPSTPTMRIKQLGDVSLGPDTAANRPRAAGSAQKMSQPYRIPKIKRQPDAPAETADDAPKNGHVSDNNRRQDYKDNRHRRDRRSGGGNEDNNGHGAYRGQARGPGKRYPDRWANYDPIGKEMEGTRFVAFKCPLDESYFKHDVHQDEFFDIHTLVSYARDAQRRLGLVIDLTNTDRYYNKNDWYDYDVEYAKIYCPGHEVNGREDIVENFHKIVDDFLEKNKDNDKLIGVHCTHGINRTGFLMCRYAIDRLGWTAEDAIRIFGECRGHGIEREKYKAPKDPLLGDPTCRGGVPKVRILDTYDVVTLREAQRRRDAKNGKTGGAKDAKDGSSTSSRPPSEADVPLPPRFDDVADEEDASEAPTPSALPLPPTF